MSAPFQVMPELTAEEFGALRADIAERGIVVPVVRDQHGRLVDGHHRERIAADLASTARRRRGRSPTTRKPARSPSCSTSPAGTCPASSAAP